MTFMDDYRASLRARQPEPNAIPQTVGVQQAYRAVPRPYLEYGPLGVTVVMPTTRVGDPPMRRPFVHDETTDQWTYNPAAMQTAAPVSRQMTVGADTYRITADGHVYKQEYSDGGPVNLAPGGGYSPAGLEGLGIDPGDAKAPRSGMIETEVTGDAVPVTIQKTIPHYKGKTKLAPEPTRAESDAGAATFGVTSPGGLPVGNPPNPADFYGSQYLSDEGMSPSQIATYQARLPDINIRHVENTDPGYARYLETMQIREGAGRPVYAPNSAGSVTNILYGLKPAQFAQLQLMMMKSGKYLPSTYVPTTLPTAAMRVGMEKLLTDANLSGQTWQSTLTQMASAAKKMAAQQPTSVTRTSSSVSLTSRDSAEQLVRAAWQQTYGEAPTEAQLAEFTRQLRGDERADPTVTTSTTNLKTHNTTSTTEQSDVDPTAAATDFARTADPQERKDYLKLHYFNVISAMTGDGA